MTELKFTQPITNSTVFAKPTATGFVLEIEKPKEHIEGFGWEPTSEIVTSKIEFDKIQLMEFETALAVYTNSKSWFPIIEKLSEINNSLGYTIELSYFGIKITTKVVGFDTKNIENDIYINIETAKLLLDMISKIPNRYRQLSFFDGYYTEFIVIDKVDKIELSYKNPMIVTSANIFDSHNAIISQNIKNTSSTKIEKHELSKFLELLNVFVAEPSLPVVDVAVSCETFENTVVKFWGNSRQWFIGIKTQTTSKIIQNDIVICDFDIPNGYAVQNYIVIEKNAANEIIQFLKQ